MQVPAPRRPSFSREEADPALWPYVTSHHREWLFSAEALAEKRAAVYGVAVEKLKLAAASAAEREPKNAACAEVEGEGRRDAGSDVKNKGEDSTRKSVVETPQQMELAGAEGVEAVARAPPTLEELLQVQQYFAMQLLTIFKEKGVKPAALEAACCFFHRFFLGTSLLEFDVRLVLFVCVILALKATDVARHFTLGVRKSPPSQDLCLRGEDARRCWRRRAVCDRRSCLATLKNSTLLRSSTWSCQSAQG